ncbi:MAG: hypothetical protein Q8P83_01655, partial [bacterium]|nr:hypothetical protein [bacterium]
RDNIKTIHLILFLTAFLSAIFIAVINSKNKPVSSLWNTISISLVLLVLILFWLYQGFSSVTF